MEMLELQDFLDRKVRNQNLAFKISTNETAEQVLMAVMAHLDLRVSPANLQSFRSINTNRRKETRAPWASQEEMA